MTRYHTLPLLALLVACCTFDGSGINAGDARAPDLPDLVRDLPTADLDGFDLSSGDARSDLTDLPKPDLTSDLPKPDTPKLDLSKPDLPATDLPKPDLPATDLPKPDLTSDLPKPDAPKPDLPQPDLPQPDFSLGDAMTDAAIALCKAKYGGAPDYVLCWVTPSGCAFNATTNGTCDAVCKSLGGSCLAAWDNSTACTVLGPDPCDKTRGTNICLCSK
jgi:hypothetical protein